MARPRVTELGYLGFGVSNLAAWRSFAGEVLGMECVASGEADGREYLRMDYWHHRIVLHPGTQDDLLYAGYRVAGPEEFREMQQHLDSVGIRYEVGTPAQAVERRVLELLRLADPAGNAIEIFHGPQVDRHRPYRPGRGMHGRFATGAGGIGHMVVAGQDVSQSYEFYHKVLGMRGSVEARMTFGPTTVEPVFMHCNERDHTVAFGAGPLPHRLHHLMVEVDSIDDVGMALDLVRKNGYKLLFGAGKHANDRMFSFYVQTPSGWFLEYGWGGMPATEQSEYNVSDMWGHELLGQSVLG